MIIWDKSNIEVMKVSKFDIEFYQKEDGTSPAEEFISSLDTKMRAKVVRTIVLLGDNGPDLREPYSKSIGDGIFEVRAKVGSNISRVLYFFYVGHKIILTNGFIKKTDKTPANEITRAKRYRADYLSRMEATK